MNKGGACGVKLIGTSFFLQLFFAIAIFQGQLLPERLQHLHAILYII